MSHEALSGHTCNLPFLSRLAAVVAVAGGAVGGLGPRASL